MGKYQVAFITLKGVDGLSFDTAYQALRRIIRHEAARLDFLKDSDRLSDSDKTELESLTDRNCTDADIRGA